MIVGQLLQVSGAQQVRAAVAHVSETQLAAVDPAGGESRSHAALLRVLLRRLVNTKICLEHSVLQNTRRLSPVLARRRSIQRYLGVPFRRRTNFFDRVDR